MRNAQATFFLQIKFLLLAAIVMLTGCASHQAKVETTPPQDATQNPIGLNPPALPKPKPPSAKDSAPDDNRDISSIPDAVPLVEPRTIAGNQSPYLVNGEEYSILSDSDGYQATGISSWYGIKFHGQTTANGEIYDLYAMTAAHKTLPIPTYLKVINLENGREVTVRVNDRGPFHDDRLIDLSYVAARKLGFAEVGTTRVKLVAIDPVQYGALHPQPQNTLIPDYQLPADTYLQVGAFASQQAAEDLRLRLQKNIAQQVVVMQSMDVPKPIFRVRVGPVTSRKLVLKITGLIKRLEAVTPYIVSGVNL